MTKNINLYKSLSSIIIGLLVMGRMAYAAPAKSQSGSQAELTLELIENTEADALTGKIELTQLLSYAYRHNPKLRAARKQWEAVLEKHPQVTAYPDPMLEYTYFMEEVETRVGPQEQKFSISQEIPFPGKLTLKGDIVAEEVEIARLEFERQTRDLIVDLAEAYYELLYIAKAIELTRQNEELVEHLANIGTTEYSMDGTTLNDVFQAQSQLAQLSYDLVLLMEFKAAQVTQINTLLNRPPEAPLGEPKSQGYQPFSYSLEELYQLAKKNQQEILIAKQDIEKYNNKIKLAKLEYFPDFKVGLDYISVGDAGDGGPSDSGQDAYMVSFGLTIPLWFSKNRARVAEAEAEHNAAVYKWNDLENKAFSAVKMLFFKLQNAHRLIILYQDSLIPQAAEAMEVSETWFKTKKGSYAGLLETQSVWLNFNLAFQRALADYYQRVAWLEKLVGTSLPLTAGKGGGE